MIDVDVLIVGGGPAGSSLGYMLQKSGFTTCLVEKCTFPRMKLCGGLLTQKTIQLIDEIYGETNYPRERVTSHINLFLGMHKVSSVVTDSEFHLVERMNFDFYFIQKYKEAGGLLYEDTRLYNINLNQNRATTNRGEEIRFKILVGADGANSQVRKQVDKKYRPNAFCVEYNLPSPNVTDEVNVYFSVVRTGYAWCFPKKNHYTIGMGGIIKKNKDLKAKFKVFSENLDDKINERKIKGAVIPCGKYVKKPCRNNVLLIGDAAGFVDSLTGEGIYFAFYSAQCACDSLVDWRDNEASLARVYLKRIKYIQNKIKDANRFIKLYFNDYTKSYLLKLAEGRTTVIKYACENVLCHYNVSYTGFLFHYLKVRRKRI